MKKIYIRPLLIFVLTAFVSLNLFAGQQRMAAEKKKNENLRKIGPVQTPSMLSFGQDVIIKSALEDQHDLKIATAYNGWSYASFTTNDGQGHSGYTIMKSVDQGVTWDTITSVTAIDSVYYTSDLIVCGHRVDSLFLFFASVLYTPATGEHFFFIDRYQAAADSFLFQAMIEGTGSDSIYDVALSHDFLHPSDVSIRYSIEAVYSKQGSPQDSIIAWQSLNFGLYFMDRKLVDTTSASFGKLAMSYGYSSNSHPNGRYFVVYEEHADGAAEGHIKQSGTTDGVYDFFSYPMYLDSLDISFVNRGRDPSISVQNSIPDNDSAGMSAVVVWENNENGSGDRDIVGAYNYDIAFDAGTGTTIKPWNTCWVDSASATQARQPDICYDESADRFLLTYWNQTSNALTFYRQGFNFPSPSAWTLVSTQYNDPSLTLTDPHPQIAFDSTDVSADFGWIGTIGLHSQALFDAENLITGIQKNIPGQFVLYQNFPNPADNFTVLSFDLVTSQHVSLDVFDLIGNKIASLENNKLIEGFHQIKMDVSRFPAGYYMYTMKAGTQQLSKKIVVVH